MARENFHLRKTHVYRYHEVAGKTTGITKSVELTRCVTNGLDGQEQNDICCDNELNGITTA